MQDNILFKLNVVN